MGGLVVLGAWVAAGGFLTLWVPWGPAQGFVFASGLCFGALGAMDDLIKLARKRSLGLTGRQKIAATVLIATALFFAFRGAIPSALCVPFSTSLVVLPAWALALLVVVVFLASTNAVNFTDGLDGLAAGVVLLILAGFIILAPRVADVAFLFPLVGALVGFLWVNAHPAQLIMGDVGSFGLGGVLAAVALSQGTAFIFPLLAGVPVLEVVAVILQVASLRLFGRRVFRMSPLHHHFEVSRSAAEREHVIPACQWPETRVVVRFWIAQALFVGLAVLAMRAVR
jgi:phospho-N-acetylmuramoyl-pentapeptide-transferase